MNKIESEQVNEKNESANAGEKTLEEGFRTAISGTGYTSSARMKKNVNRKKLQSGEQSEADGG